MRRGSLVSAFVLCCVLSASLVACSTKEASNVITPKPGATFTGLVQGVESGSLTLVVSDDASFLESCAVSYGDWTVNPDTPWAGGHIDFTAFFMRGDVPIEGGSFSYSNPDSMEFTELRGQFTSPTEANGTIALVASLLDPTTPGGSLELTQLGTFQWSASVR